MNQTETRINSYDLAIAERLHQLRISRGMTQQAFAETLGVTYQQAHKYERGTNRISAGRLALLARELNIPIDYFYAGITPLESQHEGGPGLRRTMELMRGVRRIQNAEIQQALSDLIRHLAERH